jgi:hypothetical protein
MNIQQLFLQRYSVLYDFYLADTWERVAEEAMRQRPDPRVNSIAWNLWHLTRVEDVGINRFVAGRPQVLDDGGWMARLNIPWRHNGFGMTFAEVDELDRTIDLQALRGYSAAVQARTCEVVGELDAVDLDAAVPTAHLRKILFDEGVADAAQAAGLLENYTGWTRGRALATFGLTHPFQHIGEIGVIASLLGIEF